MYRIWLSVFGAGYSPIVPGTCGSAVVMVVFLLAALLGGSPGVVGAIMVAAVHGFAVTVLERKASVNAKTERSKL